MEIQNLPPNIENGAYFCGSQNLAIGWYDYDELWLPQFFYGLLFRDSHRLTAMEASPTIGPGKEISS